MSEPSDRVAHHWPHLVELIDTLDGLKNREYSVPREPRHAHHRADDVEALAEAIARELSRPGGPQIAQRAIANR